MPVPEDADSPRFRTNIGSVHYAPEKSAIIWKIKQFGGGKEFLMRAELGLPSVKGDDEHGGGMTGGFGGSMGGAQGGGKGKRPISVKFEIPYFTTSGIQVRYLKIIEPKVCPNSSFSYIDSIFASSSPQTVHDRFCFFCPSVSTSCLVAFGSSSYCGTVSSPLCNQDAIGHLPGIYQSCAKTACTLSSASLTMASTYHDQPHVLI